VETRQHLLAQVVVVTQRTPAPAYNATIGSPVINFSFTAVIINSAVDNYWPDVSGEIHPICFYITYCFL